MAYSDFTVDDLIHRLGLEIVEGSDLFQSVPPVELPSSLKAILSRNLPLASILSTEKARSEFLIAPMMIELKFAYEDRIGLFSGVEFNVDEASGLKGRCDFLVTRNPRQIAITAPVCVLVEAKNENIIARVPQCLAEMVAAQRFNARAESISPVYGVVSTGSLWRFLKLDGSVAAIDNVEYPIQMPEKIFGILTAIALN